MPIFQIPNPWRGCEVLGTSVLVNFNYVNFLLIFNMFLKKVRGNFCKIPFSLCKLRKMFVARKMPPPPATCPSLVRGFLRMISSVFITTSRGQWPCICNTPSDYTEHHTSSFLTQTQSIQDFIILKKKHLFLWSAPGWVPFLIEQRITLGKSRQYCMVNEMNTKRRR